MFLLKWAVHVNIYYGMKKATPRVTVNCEQYKGLRWFPNSNGVCVDLWKELLRVQGVWFNPSLDLSSLAKVTDGYTQGHILQAVRSVLTSQRLSRQTKKPLIALEFIPPLARQDPIYKEEEEAFKVRAKWCDMSDTSHLLSPWNATIVCISLSFYIYSAHISVMVVSMSRQAGKGSDF